MYKEILKDKISYEERDTKAKFSIWFEYFSSVFSFVEMFQFSSNSESSVKFFSAEFSVEFSLSCITW